MTAAGSSGRLDPCLALIFDMDGVVIDSNPVHREVWAAFNRSYGIETTEAMLQRMYGKRNDEIVRDFFGDDLSNEEVTRLSLIHIFRAFQFLESGRRRAPSAKGLGRLLH